jgi:hypothetical protein
MNAQLSFDTLAFVRRLAAAGMDTRHAEALADALNDVVFDGIAMKSDLRELELRLKADMKELELRLTNGLTSRMGAMVAASTALTVSILGALIALT